MKLEIIAASNDKEFRNTKSGMSENVQKRKNPVG